MVNLNGVHRFAAGRWLGLLVTVAAGLYVASFAPRGWIPHDEGLLGHSAERVLHGELPHRDFDEVYTGGLSFLHALAFQAWGIRMWSIRIVLLLFSVAFFAALYALAARVASPLVAVLVTAVCVVWSVPNYFAGLPSWYNLFLATFGVWALLRYLDTRHARWLVAAGVFGGLSLIVKIVGCYYVAAVLLFLVDYERRSAADAIEEPARRSVGFWLFVTGWLALFVAGLVRLVVPHWGAMAAFLYIVPGALFAGYLSYSEWHSGRGPAVRRLVSLVKLAAPFALGVCLPVGGFVLLYVALGATEDLYRGLFVLPQRRFTNATLPLPTFDTAALALPYALLLIVPLFRPINWDRGLAAVLAVLLLGWLALCGMGNWPFVLALYTTRPLVVALVVACLLLLLRDAVPRRLSSKQCSQLFLLSAMAAMVSLVQYPFAHYIYFCYCAPLVVLAIAYLLVAQPAAPKLSHLCVGGFYLLFAGVWLNTNFIRSNYDYVHANLDTLVPGERGGILAQKDFCDVYAEVLRDIDAHSAADAYIYAAPDCPEIYFLSGRKNPTRTMYDMFDDPQNHTQRLLAAIDEHRVTTVVINRAPEFSGSIDRALAEGIAARFPYAQMVGWFVVLWRELPREETSASR